MRIEMKFIVEILNFMNGNKNNKVKEKNEKLCILFIFFENFIIIIYILSQSIEDSDTKELS